MTHHVETFRPIAAFAGSISLWLADMATPTPDNGWLALVKEVGLPTVVAGLAIWGCVQLSKALKESQEARIADQKATTEALRSDLADARKGREEIVNELREQTRKMK